MEADMKIAVLAASLMVLSSCTPQALNPFYTAQDLVRDAAFPGVWQKAGKPDRMFCEESEQGYRCEVIEKEAGSATFDVHFMRVGGELYADLYPPNPRIRHGLLEAHLVPVHTLARLRHDGDSLRIALLSSDWVRQRPVAHVLVGPKQEDMVLALPTKELRALLVAASTDPQAFTDPEEWRKVR
jgi:hypothetical protein